MAYRPLLAFFVLAAFLTADTASAATDKFGITEIYQSASGGREWVSKWDNGHARNWTDSSNDPEDSEFLTKWKGAGAWSTNGDGVLNISGPVPRMYVVDSAQASKWKNVEITLYGRRISDSGTPWGGLEAVARTNHIIDTNLCDTRGAGARFRYDGRIDFEKETSHPSSVSVSSKAFFGSVLPYKKWIGYKFAVYDLPNGFVKLESWYDNADGLNGGNWTKINEFVDTGNNFGTAAQGGVACKSGINPAMQLNLAETRAGSETGTPNLAVYFRSDDVNTDGLMYKKASIREIVPVFGPPANPAAYWKLDENLGANVFDSSGNGNKGIIYGAQWAKGKFGSALRFDGMNDYVDAGNGTKFNFSKALTLEAWINPSATSGSYGIIGKKQWSSTLTGYHFLISGNKLCFDAGNGTARKASCSPILTWAPNGWYHVAATYSGGAVTFYRNGANAGTGTSVFSIASNMQDLYIGSTKASTYPFNGTIDEVKIYNTALSAPEIKAEYDAGSGI